MAFTLERVKPEALEVGDTIRINPYVLSATHYFFVWPVESTLCVRADNHLLLKKRD